MPCWEGCGCGCRESQRCCLSLLWLSVTAWLGSLRWGSADNHQTLNACHHQPSAVSGGAAGDAWFVRTPRSQAAFPGWAQREGTKPNPCLPWEELSWCWLDSSSGSAGTFLPLPALFVQSGGAACGSPVCRGFLSCRVGGRADPCLEQSTQAL